ncbi:MAG TPA: M28 family metallopeptidase [Terriglobia bacterium]|nr:M28 family metallopeptidase [Terriglobia bacterium]
MRAWGLFLCLSLLGVVPGISAQTPAALAGYTVSSGQAERQWEAKFRAIPDAEKIRDDNKYLSAYPHNAGSPRDKENAEWILSKFKQWGWDAHIETFYVLLPSPKERLVELVAPKKFTAKLEEPTIAVDPTSGQHSTQLPTYNMYSTDGDVTAPLVYVNYGMESDYKELERLGVSVKGALVIARYGAGWRGLKPKLAAEHGAVGCLIYSDPRDDGYWQGDVFPQGPWRPRGGVQRGSVMDMVIYPGDPLTPGVGAVKDARRLPIKEAKTITKIPVLPISYGDAQPLLAALAGPVAPAAWRGALPITYHVGPGPAKVRLKLASNWTIRPLYDVIAKIPGSTDPNEWIIRGNHHDAWVNGSEDPVSGLTPMLEEARALGEILKQGWKPKRTIIYCAWDGEEEGLLGSTEWAEEHADELRQHAAVYINSDLNDRGVLGAAGSQSLEHFIDGVAKDIQDPEKNIPVEKRLRFYRLAHAKTDADRQALAPGHELKIGALGSGSDYSAFIDHLGIASLDLGYGGESKGGIYHSIYDDFYWYSHFGDPTFAYGKALAQTAGTAVMRLADADLLPFNFTDLADAAGRYVDQIKNFAANQRKSIQEQNQEIEEGVFRAAADPNEHIRLPQSEPVPPFLNFAPLQNSVADLRRSAEEYHKALQKAESQGALALSQAPLARANQTLLKTERMLTRPDGLPGRPWYKHELYAPGMYTGYAAKTLPAVREAVEQKQWNLANQQIEAAAQTLNREAEIIRTAASQLH